MYYIYASSQNVINLMTKFIVVEAEYTKKKERKEDGKPEKRMRNISN